MRKRVTVSDATVIIIINLLLFAFDKLKKNKIKSIYLCGWEKYKRNNKWLIKIQHLINRLSEFMTKFPVPELILVRE